MELQTVVVVTGAVVGGVETVVGVALCTVVGVVRTVVGVVRAVVGVLLRTVVAVVGFVVVVAWARDVVVVVELGTEVGVVGTVTVVVGFTALASAATRTADSAHDPRKINWVKRRTRAKRRSRCWGVRSVGTIRFLCPYSLASVAK